MQPKSYGFTFTWKKDVHTQTGLLACQLCVFLRMQHIYFQLMLIKWLNVGECTTKKKEKKAEVIVQKKKRAKDDTAHVHGHEGNVTAVLKNRCLY